MMNSYPEDIGDIVIRAKRGDKEAFSYLYKNYFTPIYRYIYFRVGNKDDTEDLLQDVFLKAYKSFSQYTHSASSPLAFFYTVARNSTIDFHRKKKIPLIDDDLALNLADTDDNPEEAAVKKENAYNLHNKIAELSEEQQEVVVLRFINDLSTEEIAGLLGKSKEAVRQLQSRGLRVLRNIFNNHE